MRTKILASLIVFTPATASADVNRYEEICDGSAAVALDANHFVVADDDHDILVIYERARPARVKCLDLTD